MDFEDDGMDPWDREELDMRMEEPPVEEEQLGPPEEEQFGLSEAIEVEEPRAPVQEPTASAAAGPAAHPVPAAVLPVLNSPSDTPKRPRELEPTAQTPPPLQVEVLQTPRRALLIKPRRAMLSAQCPIAKRSLPPVVFVTRGETLARSRDVIAIHV